jgi:hypothetical protein
MPFEKSSAADMVLGLPALEYAELKYVFLFKYGIFAFIWLKLQDILQ